MSEPFCESNSRPGLCRLSGMRLMMHGDAQEYVFDPTDGVGEPGTHYR